jgi:hypothetical protein
MSIGVESVQQSIPDAVRETTEGRERLRMALMQEISCSFQNTLTLLDQYTRERDMRALIDGVQRLYDRAERNVTVFQDIRFVSLRNDEDVMYLERLEQEIFEYVAALRESVNVKNGGFDSGKVIALLTLLMRKGPVLAESPIFKRFDDTHNIATLPNYRIL